MIEVKDVPPHRRVGHQEEGVIVIQAVFDDVFEEALGLRVSSEHGGGHGTAKEERHSPPRWHEGNKEHVH
jgi:hypothetical protein